MAFIKAQAALLQWPSVQKEYWKQLRMKELALPHPPLSDMLASPMAALRKEARQQRKYAAFLHEHSGSCEDIVTTVNESRAARRDAHSQLWREEDTIHAPDISRHFQELLSLVGNEEKDSHCQAIAKLNSIIVDESVSRRSSFQASQSNSGHAPSSHSIAQESVKTPSRSSLNPASANNAISGSKGELLSTPQRLLASNDGSNVSILSDCSYSSTDSDFTSHRAACMEFTQCEAVLFAALTSCHDGFVSFLHDNKQAALGCHTTSKVLLMLAMADVAVTRPHNRNTALATVVCIAQEQPDDEDIATALITSLLVSAGREVVDKAAEVLDRHDRLVHGFIHDSDDLREHILAR